MPVTYPVRLFGGRNLAVVYDAAAGTIAIMGLSISLSSLSTPLQNQWANAVATTNASSAVPSFSGTNVQQAAGNILDATPAWRAAVQAAVGNYAASVAPFGDPENWNRI
jgi:hypothetical protein